MPSTLGKTEKYQAFANVPIACAKDQICMWKTSKINLALCGAGSGLSTDPALLTVLEEITESRIN